MNSPLTKNIWAVGRNYAAHATEMNGVVPDAPLIFLKSGNCLNPNSVIHLPSWSNEIHHEVEIAFRIDENLSFSHVTLALDLTARDAQKNAKAKGEPWTLAKSFSGSCPIGSWLSINDITNLNSLTFNLSKNKNLAQQGQAADMIFKPLNLLEFVKNHFPVSPQDILLTGTPAGVGALASGDLLQAELRDDRQILLTCHWDVI